MLDKEITQAGCCFCLRKISLDLWGNIMKGFGARLNFYFCLKLHEEIVTQHPLHRHLMQAIPDSLNQATNDG